MASSSLISKQELKRAPLRNKWANYGRNIKITVFINVIIYSGIVSMFSIASFGYGDYDFIFNIAMSIFATGIVGGILFGWNITAFTAIYFMYAYRKIKPT